MARHRAGERSAFLARPEQPSAASSSSSGQRLGLGGTGQRCWHGPGHSQPPAAALPSPDLEQTRSVRAQRGLQLPAPSPASPGPINRGIVPSRGTAGGTGHVTTAAAASVTAGPHVPVPIPVPVPCRSGQAALRPALLPAHPGPGEPQRRGPSQEEVGGRAPVPAAEPPVRGCRVHDHALPLAFLGDPPGPGQLGNQDSGCKGRERMRVPPGQHPELARWEQGTERLAIPTGRRLLRRRRTPRPRGTRRLRRRRHRQQPLRVVRGGRGGRRAGPCPGPCPLPAVATGPRPPRGRAPRPPRGSALRLPLEETLAGALGQAALHRPRARAAGFQACRRPAAGAGAGAAGLPCRLQGHGQQEAAARAEGDGAGGRGAGHRLPEPAAGGGLEEGDRGGQQQLPQRAGGPQPPSIAPRQARQGFLAVRLRGRWQRLWCAVRQGALRMFPEPGGAQRPVCALLLDGCEVTPGATAAAGSPQRLRIRIAQRGRELALLQTRSEEEREAWLKTLRARGGREPAADSPQAEPPRLGDGSSSPAAGGLLLRRFPTPNAYMDDPSGQPPAPEHVYSNTERLHRLQQSLDRAVQGQRKRPVSALPAGACSSTVPSQAASAAARRGRAGSPQPRRRDFSPAQRTLTLPERKGARDGLDFLIGRRAFPKLEEKVGQLERACRGKSRLKAGSEMNLLAIGKSLKGHIAATASSAASEGSFLSPLLRRTASARSALKRSPSAGVVEKGKVLQQRKEWEMKSAK